MIVSIVIIETINSNFFTESMYLLLVRIKKHLYPYFTYKK